MTPTVTSTSTEFRRRLTAPWTERNGKFSTLKATVFAVILAPAVYFTIRYFQGALDASLWQILVRESGLWAIRFLMLTLAVTPLKAILSWPQLTSVRRMLGVAALVYTSVHLLAYAADQTFDLATIASELAFRLYLAVGTIAFLIMVPLGITSTDAMVKRLGGPKWKRLHQLAYFVGFLSVFHFFLLLLKLITPEATIWGGLFVWMMAHRAVNARRRKPNQWWGLGLVVAAGLATMLLEAGFFLIFSNLNPMQVLSANWTFQAGLRPGWIVAMLVLAIWLLGLARKDYKAMPRAAT